jgi:hypothetical protein
VKTSLRRTLVAGGAVLAVTVAGPVETSPDGNAWTVAATGHFGAANRDRMNPVALSAGNAGVRFVRYTMLGTQVADEGGSCPSQFSGCSFADTVEVGQCVALDTYLIHHHHFAFISRNVAGCPGAAW